MERLVTLMDRHRERLRGQEALDPSPRERPAEPEHADLPAIPNQIVYTHTKTVVVSREALRAQKVVAGFDRGPFVDAYKILRTQVMHRMRERHWNVLAVTSPSPGEGKTLTAVNLAVTLAMEWTQTVLLVDADLRAPRVHRVLGLPEGPGLVDYLLDEVPLKELLVHPGIGRFVVLPGGRPIAAPTEVLTSPRMAALVEELKHRYPSRTIVFDLPPLLDAADVLAFAPYADAALMVVEEGRTTTDQLRRATTMLQGTIPIIGTVLNKSGETIESEEVGFDATVRPS